MVKGLYQIPPCNKMELLHSNIWRSDGVELLNKGFTYSKDLHLYHKGIQCVDNIWDSNSRFFFTWESVQEKFKLSPMEEGDWKEVTDNRYPVNAATFLTKTRIYTTLPGKWIGFYVDEEEDPAFVFCSDNDFAPPCMQWHNLKLPLLVQCYTVGTHSRCLREWEYPLGEMAGFFHEVKIIHTNKGPKK